MIGDFADDSEARDYSMKRVLITGGAGFIGRNLVGYLSQAGGYEITILDNFSSQVHGNRPDSVLFQSLKDHARVIRGDIRCKSDWLRGLEGQDIILHLAAETGTSQSMYEIERYADVNVRGTAILLDCLVNNAHKVSKVVFASSRAVYGEGKYRCEEHGVVYPDERRDADLKRKDFEPKCSFCGKGVLLLPTDEASRVHPSSVYGITKQVQEQMIMMVCTAIDTPCVSLRYQNVYGPGQSLLNPYTGILSIFASRIKNNEDINVFEDGLESRDFVYVDDVVRATVMAVEHEEANGEIFNVGSGVATSILKAAEALRREFSSDTNIFVSGDYRIGDIRHSIADLSKIKHRLSFSPDVSFDEGSRQFVEWVKQQEV
jgi:dTDP-L-rhamnose 4-epimerase